MPGFPLMAIGAGIGQGVDQIQRQKQLALEAALRQLQIKQYQDEQEAAKALFPAALSGALDAPQMKPLGTGGMPGASLQTGGGGGLPTMGGGGSYARPPAGSGFSSGMRTPDLEWLNQNAPFPTQAHPNAPPPQFTYDEPTPEKLAALSGPGAPMSGQGPTPLGLPPGAPPPNGPAPPPPPGEGSGGSAADFRAPVGSPKNERLVDLIIHDESAGRNIPNERYDAGHTAQGIGQITDTTWRGVAPKIGAGQYAHAMDAPPEVQRRAVAQLVADRGVADYAPFNSTLARHLGISPGGNSHPVQREADQTTLQAASAIPPEVYGRMSLQALAQAIDKANPGADPMVKMLALERGAKLVAPAEQRIWEYFKLQHQDTLLAEREKRMDERQARLFGQQEKLADARASRAGAKVFVDAEGAEHWVTPGQDIPAGWHERSAAGVMPSEYEVPDKWEGMPEKAPPGIRQDVWAATVEYVRTGKMPALGFQPGMRNLVIQATPAAQHALGVTPSQTADLQAQYAGERHGMIVGGGRAANIAFGIEEAKKAAPQVIETSKAVPRTEFPPINQFTNWLQEKTGSPEIVAFKEALNTYLNIYAATVSRTGRLTDAQQRHAYELLSTNFNQGQIDRGIMQLDYEMSLMKEAVPPAMQSITPLGQPPAIRKEEPPATPPQQRGTQDAPAAAPQEGDTATNPQTGEKIIFRGGKWGPPPI